MSELQEMQVALQTAWWRAAERARQRLAHARGENGEITATTALIVLLVIAAIGAGGVIATKIGNNAQKVPEP